MRVLLRTRQGAVNGRQRALSHLQALIVTAPYALCEITALRATARRVLALEAEAGDHESQLQVLVSAVAPRLLSEVGVGVLSAAELRCAWSHRGRIRSEAAFATLAGVAPIAESSGKIVRHRLNRAGDRQVNRALIQARRRQRVRTGRRLPS